MKKAVGTIILLIFFVFALIGLNTLAKILSPTSKSTTTFDEAEYLIEQAFPSLTFNNPVGIYHSNDDSNRLFVVDQEGIIYTFNNSELETSKDVFLDISNKVLYGGEQGLLGLAFHPNHASNGYFYLNYISDNPRRTVISRYSVMNNDTNQANRTSEFIILEVTQPFTNHNGGQIAFGPDGYLYIALGDGGSGGDPLGHGQNRS
ncbi:MAG: PQQ-dependent sugar dehydrogenase, partial [Promethearchaeota archaeon]